MTLTPTMDLGQIIQIVTLVGAIVGAHYTIKARMDSLEKTLDKFGARLDRHEETIGQIVGQIQKIIGRLEESDRLRNATDRRHVN